VYSELTHASRRHTAPLSQLRPCEHIDPCDPAAHCHDTKPKCPSPHACCVIPGTANTPPIQYYSCALVVGTSTQPYGTPCFEQPVSHPAPPIAGQTISLPTCARKALGESIITACARAGGVWGADQRSGQPTAPVTTAAPHVPSLFRGLGGLHMILESFQASSTADWPAISRPHPSFSILRQITFGVAAQKPQDEAHSKPWNHCDISLQSGLSCSTRFAEAAPLCPRRRCITWLAAHVNAPKPALHQLPQPVHSGFVPHNDLHSSCASGSDGDADGSDRRRNRGLPVVHGAPPRRRPHRPPRHLCSPRTLRRGRHRRDDDDDLLV